MISSLATPRLSNREPAWTVVRGQELRIVPHVPRGSAEPARPMRGMSLRSETVASLLRRCASDLFLRV